MSRSPLATPVSAKRDIICEERQNESVRGIGKAAEKRRGKNVRARRLIMFEMDQPKLWDTLDVWLPDVYWAWITQSIKIEGYKTLTAMMYANTNSNLSPSLLALPVPKSFPLLLPSPSGAPSNTPTFFLKFVLANWNWHCRLKKYHWCAFARCLWASEHMSGCGRPLGMQLGKIRDHWNYVKDWETWTGCGMCGCAWQQTVCRLSGWWGWMAPAA